MMKITKLAICGRATGETNLESTFATAQIARITPMSPSPAIRPEVNNVPRSMQAFFSFSSYSHGADTHSAASAAFSSCSPVPAPSAFPENGSAYVPHKETAESHRRYVSRSDGRHAYIRLARPPEICGRVLHRLLLFLCRLSKADDPRRLRRNHKQRQQSQKHAKQPEKKQRNTAQYRKNGFACLALSVFHTGNLLRRQRIVLQHHILLDRIWTSDHSLKRCNIIQEPFVF